MKRDKINTEYINQITLNRLKIVNQIFFNHEITLNQLEKEKIQIVKDALELCLMECEKALIRIEKPQIKLILDYLLNHIEELKLIKSPMIVVKSAIGLYASLNRIFPQSASSSRRLLHELGFRNQISFRTRFCTEYPDFNFMI